MATSSRQRDDPFGFAFGPQGPPRTPQQHPGDYSFVKTLLNTYSDLWHSQYDPVRAEKTFGGRPRKSSGSLVDQLLPITDQGMQNWSAIFQPGGKGTGGKMTNLTQADREFLASLQNVKTHKGLPDWMREAFDSPLGEELVTRLYQEPSAPPAIGPHEAQSIAPILNRFGAPTPNPLGHLVGTVNKSLSGPLQDHSSREIQAKLGMFADKPPWWVEKKNIDLWQNNAPGHPATGGAVSGMRDDEREVLGRIIDTILRRRGTITPGELGPFQDN